jgi:hypothetical protein
MFNHLILSNLEEIYFLPPLLNTLHDVPPLEKVILKV